MPTAASTARKRPRAKSKRPPRISRTRKPENMSLEEWQIALRRQIAAEKKFKVRSLGAHPFFSEFNVTNPETQRSYTVVIRGEEPGANTCSCPDFEVNTLGTCKHIEALLRSLRRKRGGKKALAAGYRPPYSEICLRYGAQRQIVFRPAPDCPPAVLKLAATCFEADGVLRENALGKFSAFLRHLPEASGEHDIRCGDDALQFAARLEERAERTRRIDQAFSGPAGKRAWKTLLKTNLYPYQKDGALFAAKTGRCLIADDMGLGKTVQAIAASEILARHAGLRSALIVCPTSLKHQWQLEIERFTGRPAVVVEGGLARRRLLYRADAFFRIVNYDVLHRDLEDVAAARFDLIVLDEAQRIKNWKTRAAKAVKQLDSEFAIVLTGTPLENRLEELHSIVEFVDRFRLGPMFRFLDRHQHTDDHGRVIGYRELDAVSRTVSDILLRRTKDKVLKELPDRLEKKFFVPMTEEQVRHHEENRETVARIVSKWRRYGFLSEMDQRRLTCALQNMRMSCDSAYLLDGETEQAPKVDEVATLLGDILEEPDAKVVVFSQWLRMHKLMEQRFKRQGWNSVLFHGGVPGPQRKTLVKQFREDPDCRLFLATDAGGVGLNLQNASAVINMDLPWNPAVLEQRIGRVHRLGQHRAVQVAHFISRGTIEEGMLSLLAFKKSMFAGVLDGGAKEVFLGGTRLKRFMESVETATGTLTTETVAGGIGLDEETAAPEETRSATEARAKPAEPMEPAVAKMEAAPAAIPPLSREAVGDLLTAGAQWLAQVGQALRKPPSSAAAPGATSASPLIAKDELTGKPCLKLPLPDDATLQSLVGLLQGLAGGGKK